jgi:hypothetical protein
MPPAGPALALGTWSAGCVSTALGAALGFISTWAAADWE